MCRIESPIPMAPTIQNANRRSESEIPTARFSIGEDDEDAPFVYKRRRFSQPRRSARRSRSWVVAEEDDEAFTIDDAELDSQETEEEEVDEFEVETDAEEEVGDDDGGGSAEAEPVIDERNQHQQMISSTSASSLRGIRKIGALLRRCTSASRVLNKANGELQLLLTDPDVLECPICLDLLRAPVFQCENGHIACFSCCLKVQSKCPFCCMPIGIDNHCQGLEKFIESISRISCKYARNGCRKKVAYSKKSEHELMCPHAPCDCPHPSCSFAGSLKNLYFHFGIQHQASTIRFTYNTTFEISIRYDQKKVFLQERDENAIFILNHQIQRHGSAFSVDRIGRVGTLSESCYVYQLTAKNMDTYLSLQSVPEIYAEWSNDMPRRNYLTVPFEFGDYDGVYSDLSVCIKKGVSSEFGEGGEEEVEEVFGIEDYENANGALQVVVTDPDIFLCSLCLKPLWTPIFQCQKGHLACSSCCSEVRRICLLSLSKDTYNRCRGLEKVIESAKISCINSEYGCRKIIPNNKRNKHEETCPYATCFCPYSSCPFSSSSSNLYIHFEIQHAASTIRFTFNTTFTLCVGFYQRHTFLQEQNKNVIFILNHGFKKHGRVFNVECVGTRASTNYFVYQLTAKNMETSHSLQSVTEIHTKWSEHTPTENYLTVPFDFTGYNLSLSVCIKEGIEALRWRIFGDDD